MYWNDFLTIVSFLSIVPTFRSTSGSVVCSAFVQHTVSRRSAGAISFARYVDNSNQTPFTREERISKNVFGTPAAVISSLSDIGQPNDIQTGERNSNAEPSTAGDSTTTTTTTTTLIYLEINGWLVTSCGVTILIDPILEGNLDFGVPFLYQASKKRNLRSLPSSGEITFETLPFIDAILITQGLDDHAHKRTLQKLRALDPGLRVVAPPSAKHILERQCGFPNSAITYLSSNVRKFDMPYFGLNALPVVRFPSGSGMDQVDIRPRQDRPRGDTANDIHTKDSARAGLSVTATSGALVGPPWQQRENGYILRSMADDDQERYATQGRDEELVSIYIEPHVEFDAEELSELGPVDAVITPCSGMGLPGFELVHGPDETIKLLNILRPRWVLPMANGDIDASGLLSPYINEIKSSEVDFYGISDEPSWNGRRITIIPVVPGESIQLSHDI